MEVIVCNCAKKKDTSVRLSRELCFLFLLLLLLLTLFAVIVIVARPSHAWLFIVVAGDALHLLVRVVCPRSEQQVAIRHHLVLHSDLLVFEVRVRGLVLLFIDRRECVLGAVLRDDLHVERARGGNARPNAGKDDLMDVGDFDEHRLLGNEEDEFFEHEEIALDGFQVGLETGMPISAEKKKEVRL